MATITTLRRNGNIQRNFDHINTNFSNVNDDLAALQLAGNMKEMVKAATTANITLSGAQTIDGVSIVAGNRVLVKNQSQAKNNGIYVAAASTWSRATDADSASDFEKGVTVKVEQGTVNADKYFTLTTDATITLGTTELTFSEFDAYGATDANTANKVVKRDDSGNFAAGTITANITGNCSGSSGSCTGNAATATQIQAASIFKSTEQTGNGSAQDIAHGLTTIPSLVFVMLTDTGAAGTVVTEGSHDATNCVVTVTTGSKYKVIAIK